MQKQVFPVLPLKLHRRSENPTNLMTIGDATGSSKLLVPGRATASTNIPQGAITVPIDPELLRGQPDVIQILVGADITGIIEMEASSKQIWSKNIHWIRAVRLSDDCHSYNVQLKFQPAPNKKSATSKLILQAVRSISVGQELLLWFSEDILALMQMVFLTPANIQGQKRYVCTRCSTLYESPNPLKLHIILGCGRENVSDLWNKLSQILLKNNGKNPADFKEFTEFTFRLVPENITNKQKNAIDLSTSTIISDIKRPVSQPSRTTDQFTSPMENDQIVYRPFSEPSATYSSAFKPFYKIKLDNHDETRIEGNSLQWTNFSYNGSFYNHNYSSHQNDESQIESLVSSLGKSKEGHVCLYCGKCYSRKYGLKIHIRTHTGYKPLKCKFCLRPFGDPSNLNKHVRLHAEGDTPYKCELCGKILVRRRDLERHLKSRHLSEMHPGRNIVEEENKNVSEVDVTDDDNEDVSVDR